jgi:sugar transferase EpsL
MTEINIALDRSVLMIVKRLADIVLSLALLVLTLPIIAAAAILVKAKIGSPIIFKQERPGLDMKPFWIYKFRTMTNDRDWHGNMLSDEVRLTPVGAWLRRHSIDELPQLFNVLKGNMSLVGPRPLLMRYLPYFNEREKKRFLVKPGITGLAQIAGRTHMAWNERLELDSLYTESRSLALDIDIILKTIVKVYRKEVYVEVTEGRLPDLDSERANMPNSSLKGATSIEGSYR